MMGSERRGDPFTEGLWERLCRSLFVTTQSDTLDHCCTSPSLTLLYTDKHTHESSVSLIKL